ncbi:MAG: DUF6273 domain-containing protein [Muribaculum sp.]|nr:DUF6273 domain-containing protein [Muribaculum sp.]
MKNIKKLIVILLAVEIGMFALNSLKPVLKEQIRQYKERKGRETLVPVDEHTTLADVAYDRTGKEAVVYLKESGSYIPYLVLESDYGGNVLLLRKYVIPKIRYQHPTSEDAVGVLSGGWVWYDYGSYYETSSIDAFLNTDFLETLSPEVQTDIVDTTIEVTDMESYQQEHWAEATHRIERKVFLLSALELGITFGLDYNITREGTTLKYFEDVEYFMKKAFAADETAWPYWTRTPWIWETCEVVVIGVKSFDSVTADSKIGARPAFCLSKDTALHLQDGILSDSRVYVLDLETEIP